MNVFLFVVGRRLSPVVLGAAWAMLCIGSSVAAAQGVQQEATQQLPTNLLKEKAAEYITPDKPQLVEVGPATYLTIGGKGSPGGAAFGSSMGALYSVAGELQERSAREGRAFVLMPSEAQWWGSRSVHDFQAEPRDDWHWKLLIRIPESVSTQLVKEVSVSLGKRVPGLPIDRVLREVIQEGLCVQVLHVGPYDKETAKILAMREYAKKKGLQPVRYHHEIYLSPPNPTAPEKNRVILRQPVKKAGGYQENRD